MGQKRYSEDDLIDALKMLYDLLGRTPRTRDANAHPDVPTAATYINHFGSWQGALEAADIPPHSGRKNVYDRETLSSHLRELAETLGRRPTTDDLRATDGPWPGTYRRRFGSWRQALREAGLELGQRWKRYDRAELLDILRELAEELGHTPSTAELWEREDLPAPTTYKYRFGRWTVALREAGLPPWRISRGPGRTGHQGIPGETTTPADGPEPTYGKGRQPLCSIEDNHTGRTVTAFEFEGRIHRAVSWTGAAAELFSLLCETDRQGFEEAAVTVVGQRWRYFARDLRMLREPARIQGTDLFFEANLGAHMLAKICYTVIERMGFDRSILSFETES
jgi:hypothetical protein